ncbi:YlaF family protein [Alkalihalobacillus sp. NPDC078783]
MKKENLLFLLLAAITVACIMSIGIAVAERSIIIALLAVAGVIIAMGLGFTLKKRIRENNQSEIN